MEKLDQPVVDEKKTPPSVDEGIVIEAPINPSGHVQELERNFGVLSLCSFAITSGNTWVAAGGSLVDFFQRCLYPQTDALEYRQWLSTTAGLLA